MPKKRITPFAIVAIMLLVVLSACAIGGSLFFRGRNGAAEQPTATLWPTITPTQVVLSTVTPLPTPKAVVAATLAPTITPAAAAEEITIEITEAELRDALFGNSLRAEGIKLSDATVTFGNGEVTTSFQAKQEKTGLHAGVTLRAVPVVVDGAAYLKVEEVALDDTVTGLTRMIAQAAIEAAIKQSSGEHGIPLKVSGMWVSAVRVEPGKMTIVGRAD
ncbi:MAG: hypothetical protein ACYC4R_14610 [Anaerolineae bacterium]